MKSYCINCNDFVDFTIEKIKETCNIHEKDYIFDSKLTFCKECGDEVLVPFIMDENIKSLHQVYFESKLEGE